MVMDANHIMVLASVIMASGVIGAGITKLLSMTRKAKKMQMEIDAAVKDTVKNLTYAVAGKPADQWGPAEPGLIAQMAELTALTHAHLNSTIPPAHTFRDEGGLEMPSRTPRRTRAAKATVLEMVND